MLKEERLHRQMRDRHNEDEEEEEAAAAMAGASDFFSVLSLCAFSLSSSE